MTKSSHLSGHSSLESSGQCQSAGEKWDTDRETNNDQLQKETGSQTNAAEVADVWPMRPTLSAAVLTLSFSSSPLHSLEEKLLRTYIPDAVLGAWLHKCLGTLRRVLGVHTHDDDTNALFVVCKKCLNNGTLCNH